MIQVYHVLLPPEGDGIEPSRSRTTLPAVPSAGDRVRIDWEEHPNKSRWFVVDHVRWWPGENRADIVGRWAPPAPPRNERAQDEVMEMLSSCDGCGKRPTRLAPICKGCDPASLREQLRRARRALLEIYEATHRLEESAPRDQCNTAHEIAFKALGK